MRKSIYISERLDKDIIQLFRREEFRKDFSQEVKNLLRDGLKWREFDQTRHKDTNSITIRIGDKEVRI